MKGVIWKKIGSQVYFGSHGPQAQKLVFFLKKIRRKGYWVKWNEVSMRWKKKLWDISSLLKSLSFESFYSLSFYFHFCFFLIYFFESQFFVCVCFIFILIPDFTFNCGFLHRITCRNYGPPYLSKLFPTEVKKYSCFRKCRWREKSSPERPQIYFFNRFSGDILFSSSFFFFDSCFCLFFGLMLFEIENVYSDTHSTMRADEW